VVSGRATPQQAVLPQVEFERGGGARGRAAPAPPGWDRGGGGMGAALDMTAPVGRGGGRGGRGGGRSARRWFQAWECDIAAGRWNGYFEILVFSKFSRSQLHS
jgi:hypothetical protein